MCSWSAAVLLFIEDRQQRFDEYHRVLKPGGRLSLGEPINSWMSADQPGYVRGYDVTDVIELERKLHEAQRAATATNKDDVLLRFRRPRSRCDDAGRRVPPR